VGGRRGRIVPREEIPRKKPSFARASTCSGPGTGGLRRTREQATARKTAQNDMTGPRRLARLPFRTEQTLGLWARVVTITSPSRSFSQRDYYQLPGVLSRRQKNLQPTLARANGPAEKRRGPTKSGAVGKKIIGANRRAAGGGIETPWRPSGASRAGLANAEREIATKLPPRKEKARLRAHDARKDKRNVEMEIQIPFKEENVGGTCFLLLEDYSLEPSRIELEEHVGGKEEKARHRS